MKEGEKQRFPVPSVRYQQKTDVEGAISEQEAELGNMFLDIWNDEANRLARETDIAHRLSFGRFAEPELTLEGLCQMLGRRAVALTASGLSQRFQEETADVFQRLIEVLSIPLLRRFEAAIVLLVAVARVWWGCGGRPGASARGARLLVRWEMLAGQRFGARLTDGRRPFDPDDLPAGALSLANLSLFSQERSEHLTRRSKRPKR